MRVVVTGGNGTMGRPVVKELTQAGHQVTVFDRTPRRTARGVRSVVGNHDQIDELRSAFAGADCVCHMSAEEFPSREVTDLYRSNVEGTRNVFTAARDAAVRRVVFWGSVSALGWSLPDNTFEPEYLPIDENHRLQAVDPYGLSKAVGEDIGRSFAHEHGVEVLVLRHVFTPSPMQMVAMWRSNGKQHGRYIHYSYVDVGDQATAARLAVEADYEGYEVFFIAADDSCAPEPLSVLLPRLRPELGNMAAALTGTKSAIANDRAKHRLGWKPTTTWRSPPMKQRALYLPRALAARTRRPTGGRPSYP